MRKIGFLLLAICFLAPAAYGQSVQSLPSTVHVFPEAADGLFADGSSFRSLVWIQNTGIGDVSCRFDGPVADRFSAAFTLPGYNLGVRKSAWSGPFKQGVLTLNCSGPVMSSLTYQLLSSDFHVVGQSTVFSAKPVTQAQLYLWPYIGRLGVAIANLNNSAITVQVLIIGQAAKLITIQPNSSYVGFVDELFDLSNLTAGDFVVESLSGLPFHVTALLFSGLSFTTLVPGL